MRYRVTGILSRFSGLLSVFVAGAALAQSPTLPHRADDKHLGVASCASSVCHGSSQVFQGSNVRQDEFAVWQQVDRHAEAFQVLYNDESKRIARNLGLESAHTADMCLDCHSDNIAPSLRGEKFQLSDGVGCEGCHGGAERWISAHTAEDATHERNVELGLYPLEDPVHRAELCLGCHLGAEDQLITHEIMGAGHPRISFELDTFTWLQPHYEIDQDYIDRKGNIDGVRDWAIGQGVAAKRALELLVDDDTGWNGIFPELVLFDCHACHEAMSAKDWAPRRSTGLGPGVVRLNDSNLLMFRHVMAQVSPDAAGAIERQTRALHLATTQGRGATISAANNLMNTIDSGLGNLRSYQFDSSDMSGIISSIVSWGERGEYRDYAAAEQVAMASQAVVAAFEAAGLLDEAQTNALYARIDQVTAAADNDEAYRPSRFTAALKELRAAVP